MPKTKGEDPEDLLRRALAGLDAQIAELQDRRTQLAALVEPIPALPSVAPAAPLQQRRMSTEARAKISAAAKARWAKRRKAQVQKQQLNPTAKKAKAKPAQKKAATKKTKAKSATPTPAA